MGILADIAKTYTKNKIGISFGLTHDRLGFKSVTRREWSQRHFMTMTRYHKKGDVLPVFDKSPRTGKAKQLGWMRILDLSKSNLELTVEECALEGYPELTPSEFRNKFFPGKAPCCEVIRVEFEFEYLELDNE